MAVNIIAFMIMLMFNMAVVIFTVLRYPKWMQWEPTAKVPIAGLLTVLGLICPAILIELVARILLTKLFGG